MKTVTRFGLGVLGAAALFAISANAAPVIYEGFDYDAGGLNTQGGSETGLTGTWTANASAIIGTPGATYGTLATSGNQIGQTAGGSNNFIGARTVSASALAGNGLLDDGEELWFSIIMGYGAGGNRTNTRLAFALANSQFSGSNFRYNINNEGAQLGSGLGVTMGRFSGVNGKIVATQFRDPSTGTGFAGNVFGNSDEAAVYPGASTNVDLQLIVGKITWGAVSDTIDIYVVGEDLVLGSVHSSLSVAVNQATFDTITLARGDVVIADEIRFGATFSDVVFVPEPTSLALLGLGSLLIARRRRG